MKTKTIKHLMCFFIIVIFFSCKKNDSTPTPKSKTTLITTGTWIYSEYYRGYNTSSPVLYFKRGNSSNLIDLSVNKITFRNDGTYTEQNENGVTLNGTWVFLNNETVLQVKNSFGTYNSTIILLDENNYHWLDPVSSNGTFGKLIHL